MSETFRDERVSGIDLERRSQFLGGLVQMARQGITLCGLDVRANQLGAQRDTPFDDIGILRGVTRGLFVSRQRFVEPPCCFGFVAPLGSLLCALGIGAHQWGLRLRWCGCLRGNPATK